MVKESASVRWATKIPLAMHTGNVGSAFRKRLAKARRAHPSMPTTPPRAREMARKQPPPAGSQVAEAHPGEMLVNELFIGDHAKINRTCVQRNLHRKGGFQQHLCYMTFQQQCSYKYLLNSASIGYANKFKYLLLCGSVVIYVQDGMAHKEFYEYGLVPGIHYVTVPNAAAVPAMVRWLQAHDSYARAVAAAGRARMATLTTEKVGDFFAELFTQARHVDARRTTPPCCCSLYVARDCTSVRVVVVGHVRPSLTGSRPRVTVRCAPNLQGEAAAGRGTHRMRG